MIKIDSELWVNPSHVSFIEVKPGGVRIHFASGVAIFAPSSTDEPVTRSFVLRKAEELAQRLSFGVDA